MKRWWQVPALLTPFLFSSLSHSRCIGSLWVQLMCSEYLYRLPGSPVLWDGGVKQPCFFKEPSRNCHSTATLERHHGDLVTLRLVQLNPKPNSQLLNRIQSHVVMDHAHTSAVLVLHKGSVLVLKWWSCVLMCVGHGSPTPSPAGWWMAQTGLAQETQDFVEAADVQVLSRFIQGGMTLKR